MNNFYVYIIQCPETGAPVYVGKGKGDRYLQHYKYCDKTYNRIGTNRLLRSFLRKLKKQHIQPLYEVYQNLTEEGAFSLEIDLIKQYGKKLDGSGVLFNIADGGEGGRQPDAVCKRIGDTAIAQKRGIPVVQYSNSGVFIQEFSSANAAARSVGAYANSITSCCKGNLISSGGYKWSYVGGSPSQYATRRRVVSVDDIGNELVYESIGAAARALQVDPSTIRGVLNGQIQATKGFKFKYVGQEVTQPPVKVYKFAIINPTTNTEEQFHTKNDVARRLQVSHQAIGHALRHNTKCRGFKIIALT